MLAQIRNHGGLGLALYIVRGLQLRLSRLGGRIFDWRHQVKTAGVVDLEDLGTIGPNAHQGVYYVPTPIGQFRRVIGNLPLPRDKFVFVDIGSGMGRCLLLAAEFPFRKILGVEFASELCAIADRNADRYAQRYPNRPEIDVQNIDALQLRLEDADHVLFMYNPFAGPLVSEFFARIDAQQREHRRNIYLVYFYPKHAGALSSNWRPVDMRRSAWDKIANPVAYQVFQWTNGAPAETREDSRFDLAAC